MPFLLTQYQRFLFLLLAVSIVTACGFKLRGSLDLSDEMSPVYLQQNSVFELGRVIKSLLESNKIKIAETEKQSNSQLVLLSDAKSRRILSVDSNGRAREYLLSYSVTFSVKINGQEAEAGEDSINVKRSLLFDPDAVLAVVNESEVLYKDMRRDAARLILLKLQARSKSSIKH